MPIKINNNLPSAQILSREGIFIMSSGRAEKQDIRPLKIAIMNIMPTKIETETQLMRLIGNTSLQIEITLLHAATHKSKNTPANYLDTYYKTFNDIKDYMFDGFILTGAPVELLNFSDVTYWDELKEIMEWSRSHVFSTMHICWGAQAGLYYHFNIPKYVLEKKLCGIYNHKVVAPSIPLMTGFDDTFYAPHSRYTEIRKDDVLKEPDLRIVSESNEAGILILAARKGRQIFITGHLEYDRDTLKKEYERDIAKGIEIDMPAHYFPDNNPANRPPMIWKAHANLLFSNWLNYYVYQKTPFDLSQLKKS